MPLRLEIVSHQRAGLGAIGTKEFGHSGGTIGRSLSNDWALPDVERFMSARHASIDYRSGTFYIIDLSTNGVFVNEAEHPVGRGKPQRLFSGDRIRIGEYVIVARIDDEDNSGDDFIALDHVDPVERAQRVEDPEPTTHDLIDAHIMTGIGFEISLADSGKHSGLAGGGGKFSLEPGDTRPAVRKTGTPAASPQVRPAGAAAPPPAAAPRPIAEGPLAAFFRGAGLEPRQLDAKQATAFLLLAGQLLRAQATALAESLQTHAQFHKALHLDPNAIQLADTNPLKRCDNPADAVRKLLFRESPDQMSPADAVRDSWATLGAQQKAMLGAFLAAIPAWIGRLDPKALESEIKGASDGAGGLLKVANRFKFWEQYCGLYADMAQRTDGPLPAKFLADLASAYAARLQPAAKQSKAARADAQ